MSAIAVGKFDALHVGHCALVAHAPANVPMALLSFTGMAAELGWLPRAPLIAPSERARVLDAWAAQLTRPEYELSEIALPFAEIRRLNAGAFLQLLRSRFHADTVIVGADFRGGHDRRAGVPELRAEAPAGLQVIAVEPVLVGGEPASSSRVRAALAAGDLATVAGCLGRPYRVVGTVVRGDGRGQSIGVPTANLGELANQAPGPGVYAAVIEIAGRRHAAAVNVGSVPTAGVGRPLTVEAHVLDFTGDLYGQTLVLEMVARLRDERRFSDFATLVAQIHADIAAVRTLALR